MITFDQNELVYVKGIGYGNIVSCGSKKRIVIKGNSPQLKLLDQDLKLIDKEQFDMLMIMMGGSQLPEQPPPSELNQPEDPENPNIVKIKLRKSGVIVYTTESNLSKTVDVWVKSFICSREQHKFTISISQPCSKLSDLYLSQISQGRDQLFYNKRLIFPSGIMQEINLTKPIRDQEIPNQAKLILIASQTFSFDPNLKSPALKLANSNLTLSTLQDTDNVETCLGSISIQTGRHYWEIKLDRMSEQAMIFIGVASSNFDLKTHPVNSQGYWGIVPGMALRFCPGLQTPNNMADYGIVCYQGDKIGVLVEFKNSIGSLSFFRNGMYMGLANSGIKGPVRPAVSFYLGQKQISLDGKATLPLYDFK